MANVASEVISPARFAAAILDLPFSNLYTKAAEIQNSIAHLKQSNEAMLPFAEEGDQDCKEAMFENLTVIGRMNERIALLKGEVERRGGLWSQHGAGGEDGEVNGDGDGAAVNGEVNGAARRPSGRLTDEELRRRMHAQLDGEDENEDGVHL